MHHSIVLALLAAFLMLPTGAVADFEAELRNAPGLETATARHERPILLFFTAPWCTACKGVKRNVLSSEAAREILARYILVEIDIEHGPREAELAEQWSIAALPTLIVLGRDGTSQRYAGRLERKPLLRWLERNVSDSR